MARTIIVESEAHVKREVRKILDSAGAFYFMPSASIYGKAGVSDFIGLHHGRFFAIETKFGSNKPTALQLKFGQSVIDHGGVFLVINEKNLEQVSLAVVMLGAV